MLVVVPKTQQMQMLTSSEIAALQVDQILFNTFKNISLTAISETSVHTAQRCSY